MLQKFEFLFLSKVSEHKLASSYDHINIATKL